MTLDVYRGRKTMQQKQQQQGQLFRTTVGVRQGCILSPTLFNIFSRRHYDSCLEEHDGKVCIGGINITNLRYANHLDALAEEEQD